MCSQDFLIGAASNIGARTLQEQAAALHLFLATASSLPNVAAASTALMAAVDAAFSRCLAAIAAACDAAGRAIVRDVAG
jgi:hypothetical protein